MNTDDISFVQATSADVPAMARCRLADLAVEPADPRMAAYFNGEHNPQQALSPRAGYVALHDGHVVGYIAGHQTKRHGCDGELQYLFVAPSYRRRGIGRGLLRLLARWFHERKIRSVCVGVANDSPAEAKPFVESLGAEPIVKHWHAWRDIYIVLR